MQSNVRLHLEECEPRETPSAGVHVLHADAPLEVIMRTEVPAVVHDNNLEIQKLLHPIVVHVWDSQGEHIYTLKPGTTTIDVGDADSFDFCDNNEETGVVHRKDLEGEMVIAEYGYDEHELGEFYNQERERREQGEESKEVHDVEVAVDPPEVELEVTEEPEVPEPQEPEPTESSERSEKKEGIEIDPFELPGFERDIGKGAHGGGMLPKSAKEGVAPEPKSAEPKSTEPKPELGPPPRIVEEQASAPDDAYDIRGLFSGVDLHEPRQWDAQPQVPVTPASTQTVGGSSHINNGEFVVAATVAALVSPAPVAPSSRTRSLLSRAKHWLLRA